MKIGEALSRLKKEKSRLSRMINLRKENIFIEEGFIFGFDTDTVDVFEKTRDFAYKTKANALSPHILTPYPGTKLWERLISEIRLFYQLYPNNYSKDWELYNTGNVLFIPKQMTPIQLQEGYEKFKRDIYSLDNIIKMTGGSKNPLMTIISNSIRGLGQS